MERIRDETEVDKAQRTDGCFPLVDTTTLEPLEALRTYKQQPISEKRFNARKFLEVAPAFVTAPRRIEAMMLPYFIALMWINLIERRSRQDMQASKNRDGWWMFALD